MCQRKPTYFLVSQASGLIIPSHCKAYICTECGPKKLKSLYLKIKDKLTTWRVVRFWTFTLTNRFHKNKEAHYEALREVWRRWLTYMRRNKSLRESTRKFSFIKVIEMHKSGYIHLHVFVSEYIPQNIAQTCWETCCEEVLGSKGHLGQTYVKVIDNAKTGAKYVVKYVMKIVSELDSTFRKYSKSNDIILFPKKITVNEWFFIRSAQISLDDTEDEVLEISPLLVVEKHNFTKIEPPN